MTHAFLTCAALAIALATSTIAAAGPRVIEARPLSEFPREQVVIETHSARRHVFDAWRADNVETLAQGLMFVEDIAATQAMIFVYAPPRIASMWMRNTLLSLDMLFADEYGCIVKIAAHATPGSLESISSAPVPVAYVLELKAGTAQQLAIAVGDRLVRESADAKTLAPRRCTG